MSFYKNISITVTLLMLLLLPNLLFAYYGVDSATTTPLKKIVFVCYSFSLIVLPFSFFNLKKSFLFLSFGLPFAVIELFVLTLSKTTSTTMLYYAIYSTNMSEAYELLSGNLSQLTVSVFYIFIYIFLLKKLDSGFMIPKKTKNFVRLFSIFIILILFLRDVKIAYNFSRDSLLESTIYHSSVKLKKTFPLGSLIKTKETFFQILEINKFDDNNKNFSYESTLLHNNDQTIILVIGETARRKNFQIYGYNRDNNPFLSKKKNLIPFTQFTTCANFTHTSITQILTSTGPSNYNQSLNELGLIHAFKESGFSTYWISNQAYAVGSNYNLYSKNADQVINTSTNLDSPNNDLVILPALKTILDNKKAKKLIIIHCIGSHFRYNLRYPKDFAIYKPELQNNISISENGISHKTEYINSYDNSILLTDFLLNEITIMLEKKSNNSIMLYLSDHGENLYDDERELFVHGTATPTKFELEIPMFIWHSNNYDKTTIDVLKSKKDEKLSSEIIFHSISRLGGFKTKLHKHKHDIFSDSLMIGNRTVLKPDGSIMKID